MEAFRVILDEGRGDLLITSYDLERMITGFDASPLVKQYSSLAYLRYFGGPIDVLVSDCPMMLDVEIGRDIWTLEKLGEVD